MDLPDLVTKKKSPAPDSHATTRREPDAGLVSLTMTCYELFTCNWIPRYLGAPLPPMLPQVGLSELYVTIFAVRLPPLSQLLRDLVVYARAIPLPEIPFFVARLQYAPILHHNAHLPCEAKR